MPAISLVPPTPKPYAPFDPSAVSADPGFGWRLSQGLKGEEKRAAARGTLLTGGLQKDLIDYGQHAASQEYGNAYQRALSTYNTNRDTEALNYGQARTGYQDNLAMTESPSVMSSRPSYLPASYGAPPAPDGQQIQADRARVQQQQSQVDQVAAQDERNREQALQNRALAQQQLTTNAMAPGYLTQMQQYEQQRQLAAQQQAQMQQEIDAQRNAQAQAERERRQREEEARWKAEADRLNAAREPQPMPKKSLVYPKLRTAGASAV